MIQALINGLITGVSYALLALGVVTLYKCTKILNFAQSGIVLLGGYLSWHLIFKLGWSPILAILPLFIVAVLIGLSIQHFTIGPIIRQPLLSLIMMTIAVSMIIEAIPIMAWVGEQGLIPKFNLLPDVTIAGITIHENTLFIVVLGLAVLSLTTIFLRFTRFGLDFRGTAEKVTVAEGLGVNVNGVFTIAWVISAFVSMIAGFSLASYIQVTTMLAGYGLKAFCVAILGGLDSFSGAIIAGFLVGILESLTSAYINPILPASSEVIAFLVLLIVLLIRPEGLFGLKHIERV